MQKKITNAVSPICLPKAGIVIGEEKERGRTVSHRSETFYVCTIQVRSLKRNVLYDKWLGRDPRNRRFSSAKPKYCTNYKHQEMI